MSKLIFLLIALAAIHPATSQDKLLYNDEAVVETVERTNDVKPEVSDPYRPIMSLSHLKTYWNAIISNVLYRPMEFIEKVNRNKCIQDMIYVIEGLLAGEMWAIQMIDSHGKPPTGLLRGNLKWLGNYEECVKIYAPAKDQTFVGDFRGQYCSVGLSLEFKNQTVPLSIGICLPNTCDIHEMEADIREIVTNLTSMLPFLSRYQPPFKLNYKACQPNTKSASYPAIAVLTLLALIAALAVAGSTLTAIEFLKRGFFHENTRIGYNVQKDSKLVEPVPKLNPALPTVFTETYHLRDTGTIAINKITVKSFLNCFCLFTNGEMLVHTDAAEEPLLFLNGFRVLSFSWIFLCNVYANSIGITGNLFDLAEMINIWPCEIIMNGFFSVDSFFFLSGFLVGYAYFKESEKTGGQISWTYFYVHRYIRLTPVYMVILGIFATLPYILVSGVNWTENPVDPVCRSYWLWNLLYINNFLDNFCMSWSWYLALDMQFYVICPIFLITLWRWPKIGFSLVTACIVISSIICFSLTYRYNIMTSLSTIFPITDQKYFASRFADFFNILYDKPYTRISPYIIGIALAYYLKTRKSTQPKLKPNALLCGWLLSTVNALTCLFYMYGRKESLLTNSVYNSVSHTFFSLSLAWVFYACYTGQAGLIKNMLSSKMFVPLSRLTYSAYLINLLVINGYFDGYKQAFQTSHMILVTIFLGQLPITYAISFVVCMLFEYPAIRLEKLVRTKFKTC